MYERVRLISLIVLMLLLLPFYGFLSIILGECAVGWFERRFATKDQS